MPSNLLNNDLESLYDDPPPPPSIVSGPTAINFLQELGHYFQSVTTLPAVPGSAEINISDLAKSLACTGRSLRQHVEAHKKQNTLDKCLQPA